MHGIHGDHFADYMEAPIWRFTEFFETYMVLRPGRISDPLHAILNKLAYQMLKSSPSRCRRVRNSRVSQPSWRIFISIRRSSGRIIPTPGNRAYLTIFSVIAIMVMVIACINYTNLATARSVKRAKEVGLRKSFGSYRFEIATPVFSESFLMTYSAPGLIGSAGIVFLHPFNQVAHKTFYHRIAAEFLYDDDRNRNRFVYDFCRRYLSCLVFVRLSAV